MGLGPIDDEQGLLFSTLTLTDLCPLLVELNVLHNIFDHHGQR